MKKRPFLSCIALVLFSSLPAALAGAADNPNPVILHTRLGEMVDSLENAKYCIFGDIPGFTAGRLYRKEQTECQLHLIRNKENQAQILIMDVPQFDLNEIQNEMIRRFNLSEKGERLPDKPLFDVKESDWTEKYPTKKMVLRDGNELLGTLIRAQRDTVTIKTLGGLLIPVPDSSIEDVQELRREVHQGRWVRVDPNQSRLFFAPTGHSLKTGSGYFADYYIFFPTLAIGFTDFFSVSGGISLIPGIDSQLFYFAPKLTLSLSQTAGFSAGFLTLKIPDEKSFTLGYGVTTIGGNQSGITLGVGVPINRDSDGNVILLVGGESQVSSSAKLITENWIFTGESGTILFSGGIRFFSDKLAVDLALITTGEFHGGGFPFIPYVDFAVFFGE